MERYAITIGRQFGSGGLMIAKKLSEQLGIPYYDKNLIQIAAQKSGLDKNFLENSDEKTPFAMLGSLGGWLSGILGYGYTTEGMVINDSIFKIQSDIIRQLARKESCVFVGRCADYVLRDNPRCINIFVCADANDKIQRIAQSKGMNAEQAESLMKKTDNGRIKYYNFYSAKEWGSAESYHLCVNSSVLGIDATAELICGFVRKKLF